MTVLTKESVEQIEASSEAESSRNDHRHTAAEERQLVRKLDARILPIACLLYLFACWSLSSSPASPSTDITIVLDRSNLGNARLQGLPADVLGGDPTGNLFDWINSAFFFSYVRPHTLIHFQHVLTCIFQIICQVPATIISKLFPPRLWLAGAAIGWGVVSTLMVGTFDLGGADPNE